MPIVDSIVVVGFGENDKAYEAFSELKSLSDQQKLTARSAAIVERDVVERVGWAHVRHESGEVWRV